MAIRNIFEEPLFIDKNKLSNFSFVQNEPTVEQPLFVQAQSTPQFLPQGQQDIIGKGISKVLGYKGFPMIHEPTLTEDKKVVWEKAPEEKQLYYDPAVITGVKAVGKVPKAAQTFKALVTRIANDLNSSLFNYKTISPTTFQQLTPSFQSFKRVNNKWRYIQSEKSKGIQLQPLPDEEDLRKMNLLEKADKLGLLDKNVNYPRLDSSGPYFNQLKKIQEKNIIRGLQEERIANLKFEREEKQIDKFLRQIEKNPEMNATQEWLSRWTSGDIELEMPSEKVISYLEKGSFKSSTPIKLYRGTIIEEKLSDIGKKYSSWTTSRRVAENFSKAETQFGGFHFNTLGGQLRQKEMQKIYEITVNPKDILVEFNKLPRSLRKIGLDASMGGTEREVILKPGFKPIIEKERKGMPVEAFAGLGIGAGIQKALEKVIPSKEIKINNATNRNSAYYQGNLKDAIAQNETGTIPQEKKYTYSKLSGSRILGRDLGKYQITTAELKVYSPKYLGKEVSAKEFIDNPQLQEIYMDNKIKDWINKGYTDEQILAYHRGGQNVNINEPHIQEYIKKGTTTFQQLNQK